MTSGAIFHRNRWLIALSGVGIHICIGSVYAWSVFSKPLQLAFGWSMQQANFTFGLAIFTLGISAAVMGHVVDMVFGLFKELRAFRVIAVHQI